MKKMIILVLSLIMINTMNSFGQSDTLRKDPYILLKENTVTIMWQVGFSQTLPVCNFKYRKIGDSYTIDTVSPYLDEQYKYELSGLTSSEMYEFTVEIPNGETESGSFIAPPSSTETEISFYGYGDTRGGGIDSITNLPKEPPFHNQVCGQILNEIDTSPESQTLLIHAADWNCWDAEQMWDYQYFRKTHLNAIELRSKVGVVGCIGNHEADTGSTAQNFRKYWPYNYSHPVPEDESAFWHSYDYGPVHFCFIDQRFPDKPIEDDTLQKNWIENDLATSGKEWNILVFHPPVYSSNKNPDSYNGEKDFYDFICNNQDDFGVNLVLNGHVHNYSDWLVNGVHHLTIGGGGAWKDANEPDLPEDDPDNPNYIKYHTDFNYTKFDVHEDYIRVKVPSYINNSWVIYDEFIIPKSFTIKNGENIVWEDHGVHYYADDIIIESGGILTIEGDVDFQRDGKVIVEPGGQLYLDGAALSCIDNGKVNSWLGIEVWGNPNESQQDSSGIYKQGYLEINNSTIKNAQTAIALRKEGTWDSYGGGIVKAYNSNFINNAKSVHFAPYVNWVTIGIYEFEADNEAYFRNCLFTINNEYSIDSCFYKHADVVRVKGIKFRACDFKRESTANTFDYCSGIEAYNGGLSINEYNGDSCSFEGFYHGIVISDEGTTVNYNSYIQNSIFTNNSKGIILNAMSNLVSIRENTFHVGYNEPDKGICGASQAYGIFLDNSNTFVIEDNAFDKYINAPSDGDYIGVEAFNTQTSTDEIFRNTFSGLTHANHAANQNWKSDNGGDRFHGLAYYCNLQSTNNNDLFFTWDDNFSISGVQIGQGSITKTTGNTFTQSVSGYNIFNNTSHGVSYYYDMDNSLEIPQVYTSGAAYVTIHGQTLDADCDGGGIGHREFSDSEKQGYDNDYNISDNNYTSVKTLYQSLEDGGNTEALSTEVSTSWPNDMWELRADLLGLSPYLSTEILKTAADKTEVLPESVLFEILSANPDELKKAELMDYLENKEQPLPDYMISILQQLAEGQTAKTVLQNDMALYHREKSRTTMQMLVALQYDEVFDYNVYRLWLNRLGGISADRKIVASFVQESNYTDALALANIFPELYNLEGTALSEYNYYMDMLNLDIVLQQENRSPMQLESSEYAMLQQIADDSKETAGVKARSILAHFYGEHYCNCVNTTVDQNKSTSAGIDPNEFAEAMGLKIKAEPNPATTWVAFNYELPIGNDNAKLIIRNTEGKQVALFQITAKFGQKVWDTRPLKSGTYIYEFSSGELRQTGKIVIVK